ncbi:DUF1156 domain-containing protein [Archaeoglobus sp.]
MGRKLIEEWFPVKEISRDAGIEMAYKSAPAYIKHARELGISGNIGRDFFDPKIRNLHPWFARRPCSAARATTLASILPDDVDRDLFMDVLGWNMKREAYIQNRYPPLLLYTDPKRDIVANLLKKEGMKLDEIVVCDPMAGGGSIPFESLRLGFKTVAVDYNPVAYIILKTTTEYPAKYGMELANRVREEAKKLIHNIEKNLGEFYPEDSEGYIFARGIECPKCCGHVPIVHNPEIARNYYLGFNFNNEDKRFTPYISKFKTELYHIKRGEIVCPYCGHAMKKHEAYRIWTEKHNKVLEDLTKGKINEDEILHTHILLIRQTKYGYKVADDKDFKAFLEACKQFSDSFAEIKTYLPIGEIPKENEVFDPVKKHGIRYWYQLFNPRQLLSIACLVKYLDERINAIDSADDIGKASMVYLSLGISRVIDYNSILTTWKKGTIRDTLGQYARNRKVSYGEAYCEAIVPRRNIRWIFEPDVSIKTQGGIVPVLNEICKRLEGLGNNISVVHGDARKLTSYITEKLDLINVDPPYFDTHIYSDISEYFWQILRLSLNQLIDDGYLFDNKKIAEWNTHFQTLPREGELIVRKSRNNNKNQDKFSEIWYAEQMSEFFKEAYSALKDDGLLIVWFTHRTLNAWKSIISALYGSNFYVTRIWPVTTELLTRLVARKNNNVLDKTLIIVARKKLKTKIDMKEHAKKLAYEIAEALKEIGTSTNELKTFLHAAIMSSVTVEPLQNNPIHYCYSELIPKSLDIANKIIPRVVEEFQEKNNESSGEIF